MSRISPLERRFEKTIHFFEKHASKSDVILDLGTENTLSKMIDSNGYNIVNTAGQDLDIDYNNLTDKSGITMVTAFEILEHLLSPLPLLKSLPGDKLIATIPLRLWFAKAYRNKANRWDQHYHEFEDWQFDWLLEKAGWVIKDSEKWTSPSKQIGFRPILRRFTLRYYSVYAERV